VSLLLGDGTVVHTNRAALDALGCSAEDVIGLPFEGAPWWRLSDEMTHLMGEAVRAGCRGESSSFMIQMKTAEGREQTADFSLHPVVDAAGQVAFMVASACNIGVGRRARQPMSAMVPDAAFDGDRIDPDRRAIETGLRLAIERGEFHLLHQPHVDMLSGEIVGVEALLRWEHPVLGPIAPERFIPVAEEIGLMNSIGEWVIDTACARGAQWQAAGLPPVRTIVNVSADRLGQPDFSERVARVLATRKLNPRSFGIEMPEQFLGPCLDEVAAQVGSLRAMGVEIALTGFGTGQSSLTCLRRLPIDVVKIDRSLIKEITSSSETLSITRAIIGIAHSLGMKAFAEGVENAGQLELLAANRCDRFQGLHFSEPVSGDEIERLLRARRTLHPAQRSPGARVRMVMIADSDQWVREKLAEQIERHFGETVRVESFGDSQATLLRLRQCEASVVISALRMPGGDGMTLLNEVRHLQPNAIRMMLIGPADIGRVMNDPQQVEVFRYLSKPWGAGQFLVHLQAALDQSDQTQIRQRWSDATQLVQYGRRAGDLPPSRHAVRRKGIAVVDRGPLGEVLMPQSLLTVPGDLWAIERIHIA
jgi:PAS domain S-box-containing protein